MKSLWLTAAATLALAACNAPESTTPATDTPPATDAAGSETAATAPTLADIVAGDWRSDAEKARDVWRHPVETLTFFGVKADDTVVEIWPGNGWYTNILAPYLKSGNGQLIVTLFEPAVYAEDAERRDRAQQRNDAFMAEYAADPETFGTLQQSAFPTLTGPLAPDGSVDVVLTFRNIHNWMSGDYSDSFFRDAYAALKPGGVLGVVEHRLPSSAEQDPRAASGYVHEDFVKALAAAAGFEFVEASEINANPTDTTDHPFGVWTLPPVSQTADRDGNSIDGFDPDAYLAIGESDRMTLKFVKPAEPAATDSED